MKTMAAETEADYYTEVESAEIFEQAYEYATRNKVNSDLHKFSNEFDLKNLEE